MTMTNNNNSPSLAVVSHAKKCYVAHQILSIFLSLTLIVGFCPVSAIALEADDVSGIAIPASAESSNTKDADTSNPESSISKVDSDVSEEASSSEDPVDFREGETIEKADEAAGPGIVVAEGQQGVSELDGSQKTESDTAENDQDAIGGYAEGTDEGILITEDGFGVSAQSDELSPMATTISVPVEGQYRQDYARAVFTIVNQHRAEMGVPALTWDSTMEQAAKTRAAEQAVSYSHTRPDGSSWKTAWTNSGWIAENIAKGQTSPESVMRAWYDTEKVNYDTHNGGQTGHYENIVNSNLKSIGISCFESNGILYWVQDFNGVAGSGMSGSADTSSVIKYISATTDNAALKMSSSTQTIYVGEPYVMGGSNLRITYPSSGIVPLTNSAMTYNSSSTSVMTVAKTSSAVTLTGKAVGTSTLTGWLTSNTASKATATIKVMGKLDNASYCSISNIPNQTYTGSSITPSVTVKFNNVTLVKDTDYTVTYSNNRYEGTATARITGKGNYTGSVSKTFTISKPSLADASIGSLSSKTYTGLAQTIPSSSMPTITLGGKTLVYNTDYTVSYANNVNVGYASVTFTGKGNYGGSATRTFYISPAALSSTTISMPSQAFYYTGGELKPTPTVTYNGKTLVNGTDYTLSYANNTNVGYASVFITGKGNFSGTQSKTFYINPTSVAGASLSMMSGFVYSVSALKPTVTVTVNGRTLVSGTDYDLTYSNNVNAGTAGVLVTGKGNYSGSTSKTFEIAPADISSVSISLPSYDNTYSGNQITPSPKLTYASKTLIEGTDYTLSYANNVNAGNGVIYIKGIGNFSKVAPPYTFTINKKGISSCSVEPAPSQVYDGSAKTPDIRITDGDKVLAKGTDYSLSYASNTAKGTASIIVTGLGNYEGTTTSYFSIVDAISISSAQISLNASPVYNGRAQTPKPTIMFGSLPLVEGVDYSLVYANNTNAGSATVSIIGKNGFAGGVGKSFTIQKATLRIDTFSATKEYDGTPLQAGAAISGLVNGETASYAPLASQTEIGVTANYGNVVWQTAKSDNYLPLFGYGVLRVTESTQPIYRLFNEKLNSEHLYTSSAGEARELVQKWGWSFEGIGWNAPTSGTPVYRLYNPVLGHLYTTSQYEIDVLTHGEGWQMDNNGQPMFYSGGSNSIYRLYNPYLNGQHLLTTSRAEYDILPSFQWLQEGTSINCVTLGNNSAPLP